MLLVDWQHVAVRMSEAVYESKCGGMSLLLDRWFTEFAAKLMEDTAPPIKPKGRKVVLAAIINS
jgi:hypothetical protein